MVGPGVPRVQMCGLADDCPGQHVQDVRGEGLVEVPGWVVARRMATEVREGKVIPRTQVLVFIE